MKLVELPTEVLFRILEGVEPSDLSQLLSTCRHLKGLIQGNSVLYKHHYLRLWANPLDSLSTQVEPDWEKDVKEHLIIKQVIRSCESGAYADERSFAAKVIASTPREERGEDSTEDEAPSSSRSDIGRDYSHPLPDVSALKPFLYRSSLYAGALGIPATSKSACAVEKGRASAHIHCLYGVPQLEAEGATVMHPYAAAKVYDMRNYIEEKNGWGPFLDDGSWQVDWEKIEAVMVVLGFNIRRLDPAHSAAIESLWEDVFEEEIFPCRRRQLRVLGSPREGVLVGQIRANTGPSTRSVTRRLNTKLDEIDPYGITGTYLRVVCFLDYRDLWDYNWGTRRPGTNSPMRLINETEAIRMIVMSLVVTKIEWANGQDHMDILERIADSIPRDDLVEPPARDTASDRDVEAAKAAAAAAAALRKERVKKIGKEYMPIVHFSGTSRAMHAAWDPNANSKIQGTVQMTPEGELRWTTVSIFGGDEERWKSEGIQVGGIRSGRGVIGSWFDRNYDAHGPAGPTAFWKIRNEVPASLDRNGNLRNTDDAEGDSEDDDDFMVEFDGDGDESSEEDEDEEQEEELEEAEEDGGNDDDENKEIDREDGQAHVNVDEEMGEDDGNDET